MGPKFFMVVNVDSFFLSHRLPIGQMMRDKGYEVYILTRDTGQRAVIEAEGFRFIPLSFDRAGKNPFKELKLIWQLRKIYRQYQPAIIHQVTIKPVLYGSIAAKGLTQTKLVNAISGLGFTFINKKAGIVQTIVRRLMKMALTGRVNFIFQNPDDLSFYRQLGYAQENNWALIRGAGVDADDYAYVAPVETNEKIVISVTARILYDKGIGELVEAARQLRPQWEGRALFQLVGGIDPHNPAGIPEARLRESLVPGYIEWLGHRIDIKQILAGSDIVCLPSYREGLPKSLVEAMAIGRPIVTTNVPGCRECVVEEENGFLVPDKDAEALAVALQKLLNDKELREKMGRASREIMTNHFSLRSVLDQTYAFYQSIS